MTRPNELNFQTSYKRKSALARHFISSAYGKILSFIGLLFAFGGGIGFWLSSEKIIDFNFSATIFGLGLLICSFILFIKNIVNEKVIQDSNLADWLSLDIHEAYIFAGADQAKLPNLFQYLFTKSEGRFIGIRLSWNYHELIQLIEDLSAKDVSFISLVGRGYQIAQELSQKEISTGILLIAMSENTNFAKWLEKNSQTKEDLIQVVHWWQRASRSSSINNFQANWLKITPLTKDWSYGYTNTLNQYAQNLNKLVSNSVDYYHVFGREKPINQLENVLSSSRAANALLVGPPGIGKSTIVNGLVLKILKHQSIPMLFGKEVFLIKSSTIFNGVENISQAENRLIRVLDNLHTYGNGILYVEDINNFFDNSKTKVGAADFSEIISPYLSSSLQIIGSCTYQDFHATIGKNSALTSLFQKIEISEPDDNSVLNILQEVAVPLENKFGTIVTYFAIKQAGALAQRYLHDSPMPEKAIKLLESSVARASKDGSVLVTADTVNATLQEETDIPVTETSEEESSKLNNLADELHKYIVGQNEAINAIANSLLRSRAGLTTGKRPIGSFLFLGPTGVGKTETAKTLAKVYFGSESSMIRLDMSEYQEIGAISRLIGENGSGGYLTNSVSDNPYSLILLEELEKAHKDLLNIFLQVLDDGRLTDGLGRTIDFTNTIIIATSNAGSEKVREFILKGLRGQELDRVIINHVIATNIYRPEFLNRFDSVIIFEPLTQGQIFQIVKIILAQIKSTLEQKQIKVDFTQELIEKIARHGFSQEFGARPLRRYIQDSVENTIAKKIINKELNPGGKIILNSDIIP